MFPEPTELLWIGYSIGSIWTLKSKSNTWTPRTNTQTYWQREISHVMNGIIFCVCSTSAISVPPIVLKWCRKERKEDAGEEKVRAKPKPMMNLVSRYSARDPNELASTASESPGKTRPESQKVPPRGMRSNQERWDLWWALAHQTTQNGTLTKSGHLKSGNLVKCWKQKQGDPWVDNSYPRTETSLSSMTMIWTLTPPQDRTFR